MVSRAACPRTPYRTGASPWPAMERSLLVGVGRCAARRSTKKKRRPYVAVSPYVEPFRPEDDSVLRGLGRDLLALRIDSDGDPLGARELSCLRDHHLEDALVVCRLDVLGLDPPGQRDPALEGAVRALEPVEVV